MSKKALVKAIVAYARGTEWGKPATKPKRLRGHAANTFLLGVLFDKTIPFERAWKAGKDINDLLGDKNDPAVLWNTLANMGKRELVRFLRYGNDGKAFHRFPYAGILKGAAELILEKYESDPRLIWKKDSDVQAVEGRLREIPGIGVALAKMAMRVLVREYGLLGGKKSLKELNVKPDLHVKRVFMRVGFTKSPDNNEIIEAALKLFPRDPSKLDAVWDIGKVWCRPTSPNCRECPLKSACPKLLLA